MEESWASERKRRGKKLVGREQEVRALERLLDAVRGGESRALVVYGEPGVAKEGLDYVGIFILKHGKATVLRPPVPTPGSPKVYIDL